MKVTGYRLREALRRWQLRRDAAAGQFTDSLTAFPGETKKHPTEIAAAVLSAETAIATLQAQQAVYNLQVRVNVHGVGPATLLECIKHVGGLERLVAMWSNAAKLKKDRMAGWREDSNLRDSTKQAATRTITYEDAAKKAALYDRSRAAYIEAMNVGNANEIDLADLSPALLE